VRAAVHRRKVLPLAAVVAAVVLVACGGDDDDDDEAKRTTTTVQTTLPPSTEAGEPPTDEDTSTVEHAAPGPGFAVAGGGEEREVYLYRMPVPAVGGRGTVVQFHPEDHPVRVQITGEVPGGGTLTICPTGSEVGGLAGRLDDPCTTASGGQATVDLRLADGETHLGIELSGTWPEGTRLNEVIVTYRAVDEFLAVTFPES
jgi:hypothetical protein